MGHGGELIMESFVLDSQCSDRAPYDRAPRPKYDYTTTTQREKYMRIENVRARHRWAGARCGLRIRDGRGDEDACGHPVVNP